MSRTTHPTLTRTSAPPPDYPAPPPLRLLLSPAEVAVALDVDRGTVYDLMNDGSLASLHIGRMRKVSTSEIARFIAARERGGVTAPAPTTPKRQGKGQA